MNHYFTNCFLLKLFVECEVSNLYRMHKNVFYPFRYHPFYITTSPEGGFGQKTEDEQKAQKVFAGVKYEDGYPYPTAAGRYCEWVHKTVDMSADMETFENFFETLRLECDKGEPAKLVWTVTEDTPDLVYYQVFIKI